VYAARVDSARGLLAEAIAKLVRKNGSRLAGAFVVLRPGMASD
jgi:hypothetical protein